MTASYLFVPGHQPEMLRKARGTTARSLIFDLEDAVPPSAKAVARASVAAALADGWAWVRINAIGTREAAEDLEALTGLDCGIRIPKAESPADVAWVRERFGGDRIMCAIETGAGVLAARSLARVPAVERLALGGIDLERDLRIPRNSPTMDHVRAELVLASRAAGLESPVDAVHGDLDDPDGLDRATRHALACGFGGKSAIHPRQLAIINAVFQPSMEELAAARRIVEAFRAAGGAATQLKDGTFVDLPVAARAEELLARVTARRG